MPAGSSSASRELLWERHRDTVDIRLTRGEDALHSQARAVLLARLRLRRHAEHRVKREILAQFAAWKQLETGAFTPCVLVIVPVAASGSQSVGLNMKPGRSIVTFTVFSCNGTPSRIFGNGSLTIVGCAVCGSMPIVAAGRSRSQG